MATLKSEYSSSMFAPAFERISWWVHSITQSASSGIISPGCVVNQERILNKEYKVIP